MTDTAKKADAGSDVAFAILMIVVSVLIFVAVRRSERANAGSNG